ncbi:MAG: hypothetical protein RI894_1798 [Bacteroidota bacterium]|jgi:2-polyprenyl-3-methyl-5-hydroxy-6-metoxy-1,4-benzoquinol methylase
MLENFGHHFGQSLREKTLLKLSLSKPTKTVDEGLQNVYARLVQLKTGWQVQFTLRYQFRDVTKNVAFDAAAEAVTNWLSSSFDMANLHTNSTIFTLENKKGSYLLHQAKNKQNTPSTFSNNKEKMRRLSTEGNIWLHRLGITSNKGEVLKEKQAKFKQIDKYLEVMEGLLEALPQKNGLKIADMGAGKGYLTFALYDLLAKSERKPVIYGIEQRKDVVATANMIAEEAGFGDLQFLENTIHAYNAANIDVLIALHACDTATDDALEKGILAGAKLIVVAPCCHKQVRRAIETPSNLQAALQHGILLERQAELLTDAIRALVLEKHGYSTKVFEFISLEHTGKNVMITALKHAKKVDTAAIQQQIEDLKCLFGIRFQALDTALSSNL